MVAPLEIERLKKMRAVIKNSQTPIQKQNRQETYDRFEKILDSCGSDYDFYMTAWNDFPVWVVTFLDDDQGNPMFLARWQIEFAQMMDIHKYIWAFTSRKAGKSTLLAAKMANLLCGPDRHRISGFAPTHGQDFVFDKVRKFIRYSPYLFDTFIRRGGNDTSERIDTTTGSEFINRSISISTGGAFIRGEYGDVVYVDEIQVIDQHIMDTVVYPIIADAYSSKRFLAVGTPDLRYNPQLQVRWNDWVSMSIIDPDYAYFLVDCWRAIAEGCLNRTYVEKVRKDMTADDFAMEYLAQFPDTSARFFPLNLLEGLKAPTRRFYDKPKSDKTYIMAVDWAKYLTRTQILVGEITTNPPSLTYCGWTEFDPRRERVDYEEQVETVKRIFHHYKCEWIIPDTTSTQDALVDMMAAGGINKGISKPYMFREDEEKEVYGYKASDIRNYEMWRNHKQQMVKRRIFLPGAQETPEEQAFVEKYIKEHHELQAKPGRSGTIIRLEEQEGTFKDMAVTAAMMSIYLERFDQEQAFFKVGGW